MLHFRLHFLRGVLAKADGSKRSSAQEAQESVQGLLLCPGRLELDTEQNHHG